MRFGPPWFGKFGGFRGADEGHGQHIEGGRVDEALAARGRAAVRRWLRVKAPLEMRASEWQHKLQAGSRGSFVDDRCMIRVIFISLTIGQCHTSFSKLPCTPPHFQQHLRTTSNLTHIKVKILTTDHNKDKAKKHNSKATSNNPNHQPSHTNNNKILTTNQHTDNNKISNSITKKRKPKQQSTMQPPISRSVTMNLVHPQRFAVTLPPQAFLS